MSLTGQNVGFKSVLYLSIPNLKVGRQKTFHNEHLD